MKLKDIVKGSPAAYDRAAELLMEQIEFELETCFLIFGTDPKKLLLHLAEKDKQKAQN